MKKNFNFAVFFGAITWGLSVSCAYAAANFTITPAPGYPLATGISSGQTVSAYYTVINNTQSLRSGYSVQGLPNVVTQNTSSPQYCSNPISLPAKSSCILRLDITQATQANFAICKGASCTTAATPLNISPGGGILETLIGFYVNTSGNAVPLAYTSLNAGASWSLSASFPLPADVETVVGASEIYSVSCDGVTRLNCSAMGTYVNNVGTIVPLAYASSNGGNTWILSAPLPLPSGYQTSNIASLSCDSATALKCTAVGSYTNSAGSTLTFAYTSSNGGRSWSLSAALPLPSNAATPLNVAAGSVACDQATMLCNAVGVYNAGSSTLPLVYRSLDGGLTWSLSAQSLPLPPDYSGSSISAGSPMACDYSGEKCQTVVLYPTTMGGANSFSYTSTNGGLSWSLSTFPLPNDAATGVNLSLQMFAGVACDGATGLRCIAAGYYTTLAGGIFPVTYISTNGGQSWQLSPPLPLPNDAAVGANALVLLEGGVACDIWTGLQCNAVGAYSNTGGTLLPLSYISSTGGNSWTLSTPLPLPSDAVSTINLTSIR